MKETVRIGVTGAGLAGQLHVRNLSDFPDVVISAVCDPDLERARSLAAVCGATAHRTVQDMLEAEALDAVYLCIPPFAHGEPEQAVLRRRLPFYVEKPLAVDRATARAIAGDVEEAGVLTQVGHQWRYREFVPEARELVGGAGVCLVLAQWLADLPAASWWTDDRLSGGQVVEQAVHLLDLARLLVGEVDQVQGAGVGGWGSQVSGSVLAATTAILRFRTGAIGSISSTCVLSRPASYGLRLFGEGLAVELTASTMSVERDGEIFRREDHGSAMKRADRAFVDAVRGVEMDLRSPYGDALRSHELAVAVNESARTGEQISIS